mmetsp:Transcript_9449/g.14607  ORF Transcript_9449/g.14607 Transcript_9449/m.14607 type:complete len:482 (-) Transcript_9449:165-1610(-)
MMKHARPTKTAVVSRAKSDPLPDTHSSLKAGENENSSFKWAAVYWKEGGINLPENGRMKLKNNTHLSFRGIFGTKLDCDLKQTSVETESRMNGMIRDAFRVVVRSDVSKEDGVDDDGNNISYLFTTVIKDPTVVVERIQSAIDEAHVVSKKNGADDGINDQQQLRRLPPDDVLQKMTIMGKRKIKGVSMQDYFEVAWSEGNECEKEPMYEPFLTSCGKNNVKVQKWESQEGGFKGEWCDESYTQQRIVTFNFMKKTIGETLVSVQHTQRCRRVDNDRCIVHMKIDMKGFPFADCFVVEVRHVASCVGENDILVEIGLFVRFLKSCMFESKIRTNTSAETTKLQMDLLDRVIKGCKPYAIEQTAGTDEGEEDDDSDGMAETESAIAVKRDSGVIHILTAAIQFILTPILSMLLMPLIRLKLFDPLPRPKTTRDALNNVRKRIVQLEEVSLTNNVPAEQRPTIKREIEAINAALKRIESLHHS